MAVAVAVCGFGLSVSSEASSAGPRAMTEARASIVGGGKANFARWQFTVAVIRQGRFSCGGAVISATKVLTAGHCAAGIEPTKLAVIANRLRPSDPRGGEVIGVTAAQIHPGYASRELTDLGVLTLSRPTTASPIAVPGAEEAAALTPRRRRLRVAGWGARHPFGMRLSPVLKRTTERVRGGRRCRRAYGPVFSARTMLCAQGRKLRRLRPIRATACSGDSGGPLVADTPFGPRLVGVVSFGASICGAPGAPTVYSRVGAGTDFIKAALASP